MARSNDRDRSRRAPKDLGRRTKKKVCIFCKDRVRWVDYKDVNLLRKFMSDRGKIRARRVSGNCSQHQRDVAVAIKTARELALLPYTQRTVSERGGGRGSRGMPAMPRPPVPPQAPVAEAEAAADEEVAAEVTEAGGDGSAEAAEEPTEDDTAAGPEESEMAAG
jgi:small subunit ribosomal protein S18